MDAPTERMIEKVGQRFENMGLPRTAGRLVGYMIVSGEGKTQDELAEALQVSKASVSTYLRMAERMGTVERVARRGDRRESFRIADDLHTHMLEQWLVGFREMHMLLVWALGEGVAKTPEVRARMETMAEFYDHMLEEIEGAGERWIRDHARSAASGRATRPLRSAS